MASVIRGLQQMASSAQNLGDAVADSFLNLTKNSADAAAATLERAAVREKGRAAAAASAEKIVALRVMPPAAEAGLIEKSFSFFVGKPARAALWVIEQPIALLVTKPAAWAMDKGAVAFARFPKLAPAATVAAAAVGVGNWMAHRKTAQLQQDFAAQAAVTQAQPPTSYMNSVTPADMAVMEARQQEKSAAPHAGVVEAKREHAAQTSAPTAAL